MFTDEKLSAFLDGELEPAQMDEIREAIALDMTISDRLAALAEVDRVVKVAAEKATAGALPKEIISLLDDKNTVSTHKAPAADNVVPISSKDKMQSAEPSKRAVWQTPFAVAASVAVLAGLVFLNQQGSEATEPSHWASVSSVLDNNLTGEATTLASGVTVTPQLSFLNTEHSFCRQAQVGSQSELNVMIACKNNQGTWQLAASKVHKLTESAGEYRTATSAKLLEDELDNMMASAPLNREQEERAIASLWQVNAVKGVNDEN